MSRTPVHAALYRLEAIGVYEIIPYQGVRPTFAGNGDIRRRLNTLSSAVRHGKSVPIPLEAMRISDMLAAHVGAQWAAWTWDLIHAWTRNAGRWGVPVDPSCAELRDITVDLRLALTWNQKAAAAELLRCWAEATTLDR